MARYLITGGAGFIGSHLVDALITEGHLVRVLDDLSSGTEENLHPRAELRIADVTDQDAVRSALEGIDGCFHLAAIASVERGRREWLRCHTVNLSGTITVFEEARRSQAISGELLPVVYASSAAVYGNPNEVPISEDAPTRPISAYGVDKLGCDQHAAVAARTYDLSTIGLRFFNIYGPRQDPHSPYSGVISVFCDRILRARPLTVHGDGQQVRDFVYVDDAIRALHKAMLLARLGPTSQVFNVCSGVGTTIRGLGKTISEVNKVPFSPDYAPLRTGDVRLSVGDPTRAREELKFVTEIPLSEGLAQTLESMGGDRPPRKSPQHMALAEGYSSD
jgi:UDP-glucose 4-epimerase